MNISPISFNGMPPKLKSIPKFVKENEVAGLPTKRYDVHSKKALEEQVEYYREILKESPQNNIFRSILDECMTRLRNLK